MNGISRKIRNPRKYILRYLNSTSKENQQAVSNVELCDVPTDDELEYEVEEVRVRLPWKDEFLAGKWWGPKNQRPIVCLHGWQDNAGTFDRLIPLLPRDQSYLAIDLPGHGLSSRIPDGMAYHVIDYLYILDFLMKEYNWDKITLLGHSMGSLLSFTFATVFPSKVDMIIQIDALKPQIRNPKLIVEHLEHLIENFMLADQRNQEKGEPPAYTYEEIIDRLVTGTMESVTKETAEYLLKRNIKRSDKFPGKFYFTRDSRLKFQYPIPFAQEVNVLLAKKLEIPHMFIKASKSSYYERRQYYDEVLNVLKQNPKFEDHVIDSSHHLHLTHPELVAPLITNFLEKHKKLVSKL